MAVTWSASACATTSNLPPPPPVMAPVTTAAPAQPVPARSESALDLYTRACDGGSGVGCNNLALSFLEARNGAARDPKRAFALFQRACDLGVAIGCGNLGVLVHKERRDEVRAIGLLTRACDGEWWPGCYFLGSEILLLGSTRGRCPCPHGSRSCMQGGPRGELRRPRRALPAGEGSREGRDEGRVALRAGVRGRRGLRVHGARQPSVAGGSSCAGHRARAEGLRGRMHRRESDGLLRPRCHRRRGATGTGIRGPVAVALAAGLRPRARGRLRTAGETARKRRSVTRGRLVRRVDCRRQARSQSSLVALWAR